MDKTNLAQTLWDSKEKARCEECAEEHNQLAQWLIELKMLKTEQQSSGSENPNNCDLISRGEVLKNAFKIYTHECGLLEVVGVATIKTLPSIKPQESKTGHWEEVGDEYIQVYDLNGIQSCGDERICSECGFETVFIGEHCSQYKFCPNCGAKMEVEQHG
jgi:NADH pyrophosphatase NudC (nudix superfamily)